MNMLPSYRVPHCTSSVHPILIVLSETERRMLTLTISVFPYNDKQTNNKKSPPAIIIFDRSRIQIKNQDLIANSLIN